MAASAIGKFKQNTSKLLGMAYQRHANRQRPPIQREDFWTFAQVWQFNHQTSRPSSIEQKGKNGVQLWSNGFERRHWLSRWDPWQALLDFRNTPTQGIALSLDQRFHHQVGGQEHCFQLIQKNWFQIFLVQQRIFRTEGKITTSNNTLATNTQGTCCHRIS